jgi:hypothetical protein
MYPAQFYEGLAGGKSYYEDLTGSRLVLVWRMCP